MKVRTTRLILWTLGGIFSVAAVATITWLGRPVTVSDSTTGVAAVAAMPDGPVPGLPPLSDFQPLWNIDLRRPLTDAATPSVGASNTTASDGDQPPGLRLLGTIIEPGHSMAVFSGSGGLKVVGDEAAGAKIMAIEADSVTLAYNGKSIQLPVEKSVAASPEPVGARPGQDAAAASAPTEVSGAAEPAAAADGAPSAPILVPTLDYEVPH